jgi:hypothetical protein
MSQAGQLEPIDRVRANGWDRRLSPTKVPPGKRRPTEPTAAAQPGQVPQSDTQRTSPDRVAALRRLGVYGAADRIKRGLNRGSRRAKPRDASDHL